MVLLEEVVAVFPKKEAARPAKREMPIPKRERGSDRMVGSQKLEAISLGVTPATERMAASIVESKARKAGELASSSETKMHALTDEGKSRPVG